MDENTKLLSVATDDILFVYHRDERGWTYGEIVTDDYRENVLGVESEKSKRKREKDAKRSGEDEFEDARSEDADAAIEQENMKKVLGWFPTSIL